MPVERSYHVDLQDIRRSSLEVSDESLQHWKDLRERVQIRGNYILRPEIPDYIRWPFINEWKHPTQIDSKAQAKTATLIGEVYRDIQPDYIIAVGHSGLPLGTAVKKEFIATGRDAKYVQVQNLGGIAPVESVASGSLFRAHSYSRMEDVSFYLPPVKSGSTALVIDDVLAQGGLSRGLLSHLKSQGVDVVGMAVYFAKRWQDGIRTVTQDFGVPVFAAIAVDGINPDESIVLAPEDQALVRYEPKELSSQFDMISGTNHQPIPKAFVSDRRKYPTDDIPL